MREQDNEKVFLKSTTAEIQRSLLKYQEKAGNVVFSVTGLEGPRQSCNEGMSSTKCNFPHDVFPESTDRRLVGKKCEKNVKKTAEQRMRAKKKSSKKKDRDKNLQSVTPPY